MTETLRREAMRRYGRGESPNRIAKDYGTGSAALTKTIKRRGLVLREKKYRQVHVSPELEKRILEDYAAGKAVRPKRIAGGREERGTGNNARNSGTPPEGNRGMSKTTRAVVVPKRIETHVFLVRRQKVMLSTHLAELYEVEPRALVQAVKRNTERFPEDFMFQLSAEEFDSLKSQIVTSSWGGFRRAAPYAFTGQGVAMLSSVLRSPRAVRVNIEIMRAFVRLRQMLRRSADLARKLAALENKYDAQFKVAFDAIRRLMAPQQPGRRRIGFRAEKP